MALIVADTDVLIDFLGSREPGATAVALALGEGRLAATAVTAFELLAGARTARDRGRIERLLAPLPILPLGEAEAARAAALARDLAARGASIGTADTLIAGTVLVHGSTLLTRNRKHFERIPGLRLEGIPWE
jgi:tRNA(fMet)-specific endonuclease VapC